MCKKQERKKSDELKKQAFPPVTTQKKKVRVKRKRVETEDVGDIQGREKKGESCQLKHGREKNFGIEKEDSAQ